jgi:hypothetical protein
VGAGELDVDRQLGRERVHRLLALREHVQQLQPLGTGQGFADAGDLRVQQVFELTLVHVIHSKEF